MSTMTMTTSTAAPATCPRRRRLPLTAMAMTAAAWSVVVVDAFSASSSFSGRASIAGSRRSSNGFRVGRNTNGLNMMFDQLSTALTDVAKVFDGKKRMTDNSVQPALKKVRRALLDADVNLDVATALIEGVKRRSVGAEILNGVSAEQMFVKAMYDELLDVMGGDSSAPKDNKGGAGTAPPVATLAYPNDFESTNEPAVILLAGLQGAGKTTAAAKLALYLKEREVDPVAADKLSDEERSETLRSRLPKRNRRVLLAAADVYRPAAIEQLEILGKSVGVDVFSMGKDADPADIARKAVEKAKAEGYDTVLVDTAGRQVVDEALMEELRNIKAAVNPDETLLVVDAMTGQAAASLTASFDEAVGITGAILTKVDGDSRGGAAVSIRGVSGRPVKFVGVGEKVEDLEPFYADRMASRILGMGDVVGLVEKAAAEVSDADAKRMQDKMSAAEFDFDDFVKQAEMVSKMGSMAGVAKMLPGVGGMIDDDQMRKVEVRIRQHTSMICSMTKKERANPDLLLKDRNARSRLMRITAGAGLAFEEGLGFMSEFQKMRTMMSRMSKQAAMGGGAEGEELNDMDPRMAGNRNARRNAKKKGKKGRGGGGGGFA